MTVRDQGGLEATKTPRFPHHGRPLHNAALVPDAITTELHPADSANPVWRFALATFFQVKTLCNARLLTQASGRVILRP